MHGLSVSLRPLDFAFSVSRAPQAFSHTHFQSGLSDWWGWGGGEDRGSGGRGGDRGGGGMLEWSGVGRKGGEDEEGKHPLGS